MGPGERVADGGRSHPLPVGTAAADLASESDRVRLARLALSATLSQRGVAGTDAGPLGAHVTGISGGERLRGVTSAADGDGRYAIVLRVVAELVNLADLAESIRTAVRDAAAAEGLESRLGDLSVHFADVVSSAPRPR